MVISSFISSILIIAVGIWAYLRLEPTMNIVAEKQLLIEPSKFSYKMWKDMPVTMYQSFTFFNLTNWNQVKSVGQKPRFVEVGPYVYRTIWTKQDINFMDEEKLVSFAEKKQWIFQPQLSKGFEDDQIWTINTPLMTALALIQNAPVITRNIVSVILDGLGEGAFIKRNIRSLLFEGYSDLIVSVGPLFDRRFANFNGKFAYLYNKNDSVDGQWTVSTGLDDLANLNKITRFQSSIVNMTSFSSGQLPQGLNEVKAECAPAWSLDQSSNGQLFSPFNRDAEQEKLVQQLQQLKQSRAARSSAASSSASAQDPLATSGSSRQQVDLPVAQPVPAAKRFFGRSAASTPPAPHDHHHHIPHQAPPDQPKNHLVAMASQPSSAQSGDKTQLRDVGKFIFYPDLCRPIHLLPSKQEISTANGIRASRYYIDPRVFMNSTQIPTNRCYEMNPRPALANALAATINSVTGANVAMPNLVAGASSPFAMFSPPLNHHHHNNHHHNEGGLFERSNNPASFLNNALHTFSAGNTNSNSHDMHQPGQNGPVSRLGRVRQLFSNIVSQRMSAASPGSLLPSLASVPTNLLIGSHFPGSSSNSRNSPDEPVPSNLLRSPMGAPGGLDGQARSLDPLQQSSNPVPVQSQPAPAPAGGSDRWITQFRFKWPRGVFSIGQCQLGAPIYASLPHFLDADEYYLEQVDGLKPNRSLHEFYIDIESTLHSVPVGAKARLQLNVATPELRFRNIPNAMIPVLWQEVTFEIDKPIATMLYWSFTMAGTLYKLVSVLILISGTVMMTVSLFGGFRLHRSRIAEATKLERAKQRQEGQRSSWQSHMMSASTGTSASSEARSARSGRSRSSGSSSSRASSGSHKNAGANNHHHDIIDEIRHGAALNHAFSSCTEFHDRLSEDGAALRNNQHHHQTSSSRSSGPASGSASTINSGSSPKQPSSRASSHCELVSSLGTVNCAGCLLACLRHSPASANNHHHHHHLPTQANDHCLAASSDINSLVKQQITTSDIDKVPDSLSPMRESNLDSSRHSSIFAPPAHKAHC